MALFVSSNLGQTFPGTSSATLVHRRLRDGRCAFNSISRPAPWRYPNSNGLLLVNRRTDRRRSFFVQQNKIINMMTMKLGKRIHRVPISLDDETFLILSHAANYDRKDLATFIGHLVEQQVHGLKLRLPSEITGNNDCRCDSE